MVTGTVTFCAYLQSRQDQCYEEALKALTREDFILAQFWLNAKEEFRHRMLMSDISQLREIIRL